MCSLTPSRKKLGAGLYCDSEWGEGSQEKPTWLFKTTALFSLDPRRLVNVRPHQLPETVELEARYLRQKLEKSECWMCSLTPSKEKL